VEEYGYLFVFFSAEKAENRESNFVSSKTIDAVSTTLTPNLTFVQAPFLWAFGDLSSRDGF
jgi:hypothetical protein